MALYRSYSEIVNSMIERLKLTQPDLDSKPGSVARDLFIDIQAEQIEQLHKALLLVAEKQSPEQAVGRDLDRWAKNFGIIRKTGSPSNGLVVFTIDDLSTDISIPSGTLVNSRSGLSFRTIGSYLMSSAEKNKFAATANRLRSSLNLAGINDSYAIEIPVEATRSGNSGNISTFQIISSNLDSSAKVTNISSFNGGTNSESDNVFRSRVFATFSGSNTGTSAGYRNAALSIDGVEDAIVIEPGDSLMERDGTETIEIEDGSFRILNSGSGGKVDLYILGSKLEEIVESFLFSDLSGNSDVTDERNDIIPGLQGIDSTLTSEERRISAFKTGAIPLQPISSIVSVVGSSSGILAEASTDESGNVSGNYQLLKDNNIETGGSPFGYDRISFISNTKDVIGETIVKKETNSIDGLRFSEIENLKDVYEDIRVQGENSSVFTSDRSKVQLSHSPITNVISVTNVTTGETYSVENLGIDQATGLNASGIISISGKTLPTSADILSVDYSWRLFYDRFFDYNGEKSTSIFSDSSVTDSVDWGVSNGIFSEESVITQTDDGLEYQVEVDHNISRVISVYSATEASAVIQEVSISESAYAYGIVLDEAITGVVSVRSSSGVELYSTKKSDGTFSGKTIYLPSDSAGVPGDIVSIRYNNVELFNLASSDGNFSTNIITLPSADILTAAEILDTVSDLFLTDETIFIDYIANISELIPSQSLTNLPASGLDTSNSLLDSSSSFITGSNQPLSFYFATDGSINDISRFSPTRLSINVSGSVVSGKIKVSGVTFERRTIEVFAGTAMSGKKIKIDSIDSGTSIARVDFVTVNNVKYDITGYELVDATYDRRSAKENTSLKFNEFTLPSTPTNNAISLTSGEKLKISLLVLNETDFEDIYFYEDNTLITDKVFARINSISVSSGFRNQTGTLVGSISVSAKNQPDINGTYSSNYDFKAPKEGERITIRYNLNRLITDVTNGLEEVRSITADVLVKEAPTISIDVYGQIVVNENATTSSRVVRENAENAVINLINGLGLGGLVDYSDVISSATSISGVDSLNISLFNESGNTGRRTFIKALDNSVLTAGTVSFEVVSRQNFRIT